MPQRPTMPEIMSAPVGVEPVYFFDQRYEREGPPAAPGVRPPQRARPSDASRAQPRRAAALELPDGKQPDLLSGLELAELLSCECPHSSFLRVNFDRGRVDAPTLLNPARTLN